MDHNPYRSPRESGYRTPQHDAWRRWLLDRVALIVTGVLVQSVLLGFVFLLAWYNHLAGR